MNTGAPAGRPLLRSFRFNSPVIFWPSRTYVYEPALNQAPWLTLNSTDPFSGTAELSNTHRCGPRRGIRTA